MNKCKPGEIQSPSGKTLAFGPQEPILYVNDRMGYAVERADIIEELQNNNTDSLFKLVKTGLEQGCQIVNLQMMRTEFSEEMLAPKLLERILSETDALVALDTRNPELLETCLRLYSPGKALCNVVNGETKNLKQMLPIIAKYGAAVGTALVDENGIPETVSQRVAVARKIVEAAQAHGIPREDVAIDCICMPAGLADGSAARSYETIRAVHEELGAPTLLGISNIGYLMPAPVLLELCYTVLSASHGLAVAMVDPHMPHFELVRQMVEFLTGRDLHGKGYISYYRKNKDKFSEF